MVKILWLFLGSFCMPKVHLLDRHSISPHTHASSSWGFLASPCWWLQLGYFLAGSMVWTSRAWCDMPRLGFSCPYLWTGYQCRWSVSWVIINRVMMCSWMKFATDAPMAFFKWMTSTHFVKYSMVARIHMWPLEERFMGPIRSSPKCEKTMV